MKDPDETLKKSVSGVFVLHPCYPRGKVRLQDVVRLPDGTVVVIDISSVVGSILL